MIDDLISIVDFDLMAGAEFIIIIGIVATVSAITNLVIYKKYKDDKMLLRTKVSMLLGISGLLYGGSWYFINLQLNLDWPMSKLTLENIIIFSIISSVTTYFWWFVFDNKE
ncbi:MAG: hypothetical protein M3I20_01275 [Mogibacterium diversum]|jgi:hypothetical protein|uniref:hypothetical protein n=1 Tax=Mogibacterium diversum TaxID=114527 RepID=UPI001CB23460|nr:hypothetical protein [Mogibacterium diversum]MBF1341359.1 hypothetical protein [Mogibacterium diversum]UQF81655.1 MAG: hypothetical protein M3I20_01275 [Mogibacterium diversum]